VVHHLCGDGDLNLNTGLDVDDDLLNDLSGGVKVDQTLVDPIAAMSVNAISLSSGKSKSQARPRNRDNTSSRLCNALKDPCNASFNSPHLVHVPGLGALTARGLAGGDLQVLGGHADGALDAEVLGLGAVDELLADLLEGRDLAGGEGDADLVDLGLLALLDLLGIVGRHLGGVVGGENAIATWMEG